jgi:hypothetical protein
MSVPFRNENDSSSERNRAKKAREREDEEQKRRGHPISARTTVCRWHNKRNNSSLSSFSFRDVVTGALAARSFLFCMLEFFCFAVVFVIHIQKNTT